jgi:transcriptional regulator with XRE-family HTH domain
MSEQASANYEFMKTLKRLRLAAGLSQEVLAERIGVTQTTVSAWEAGKYLPQPHQYPKLAEAIGVAPFELTKVLVPMPMPVQIGGAA